MRTKAAVKHRLYRCNRTCGPFLILGSRGGWRLPRRDTRTGIHNCLWSTSCGVPFNVKFLALCSKSLQSTDLAIQKKTCVCVWLLVRSSEVGAPFHYALMPLKTDTRQKISGDRSWYTCTNMTKTLRHAHKRAH